MTGSAQSATGEQVERLLLFEHTSTDGKLERWYLIEQGAALAVAVHAPPQESESALAGGAGSGREPLVRSLPPDALDAVMRRYGRPLEGDPRPLGPKFGLANGGSLRAFRHLARFDVIGLDYLLYSPAEGEPLAALAAPICAALRYLSQRVNEMEPPDDEPSLRGIDPSRT